MDTRLALMTGVDIPIPTCQLTMHQPTLKEIAFLGEEDFFKGVQCLCLHKSMFVEDKDALETINNFQIFMTVMMSKETSDKKQCVLSVLSLTFPLYNVMLTPRSIVFQDKEKGTLSVDESNFEDLQEAMRLVFCAKNGPMDQQAFNPADDKAKEIAEKLMKGRQRVAAQKGSSTDSVFSRYLSILSIGIPTPLTELINLTMFQLYDLVERYILYMNWDVDVRCRLAGGKPDHQPDDWMKNIH